MQQKIRMDLDGARMDLDGISANDIQVAGCELFAHKKLVLKKA